MPLRVVYKLHPKLQLRMTYWPRVDLVARLAELQQLLRNCSSQV